MRMAGENDICGGPTRFTAESGGHRLDVFLSERMAWLSRSRLGEIIRDGHAAINGAPCKPSSKIRAGDIVTIEIPPPSPSTVEAEDIPLDILYEDEHFIVINKQKGLSAHPTSTGRGGTLVNALLNHCRDTLSGIGGELRPGIVHRLDKDTSGVMLAAKTDAAHLGLSAQFNRREVEKHYLAAVQGIPKLASGRIDAAIARDIRDRKRMAVAREGTGRASVTEWRVVEAFTFFSLIDAHPLTGRTHQIRVHLASIGHPLAGDSVYGGRKLKAPLKPDSPLRRSIQERLDALSGQALHAASLAFKHPISGEPMRFEAPLPDDIMEFLKFLRDGGEKD